MMREDDESFPNQIALQNNWIAVCLPYRQQTPTNIVHSPSSPSPPPCHILNNQILMHLILLGAIRIDAKLFSCYFPRCQYSIWCVRVRDVVSSAGRMLRTGQKTEQSSDTRHQMGVRTGYK